MRFMWESSIGVIKVFMHAMHGSRDTIWVGTGVTSFSKHALHGNGNTIRVGLRDRTSGKNLDISVNIFFIRNSILQNQG